MSDDLEPKLAAQPLVGETEIKAQIARRTRRAFVAGAGAAVAAGVALRLYDRGTLPGQLRKPLRAAEDFNAVVSEHVIGETRLAPTYPRASALKKPRSNGPFGIRKDLDPASWRLQVTGLATGLATGSAGVEKHPAYVQDVTAWKYRYDDSFAAHALLLDGEQGQASGGMMGDSNKLDVSAANSAGGPMPVPQQPNPLPGEPGLLLTMEELKKLPYVEQVTEFKCVEGWSEIIHFGGVRFRDFMELYPPRRNADGSLPRYAAMTSIDGAYFCGFEMASLLHPQTLLCFQMSGAELTPAHGAPLRLAMPLKYGYKQIKQIARIGYMNAKPEDYWATLGFDWHGGL